MSGPEDNPRDEEPIDQEEYEKAMTTKPSNSISERARELYRQLTRVQLSATAHQEQYEQTILAALEAERTDAFNLGAGGAFEASAQRCEKNPGDAIGRAYAKAVREATSADALAAIERKVAEARLELVEELNKQTEIIKQLRKEMKAAGAHIGDQDDEIAKLQAEAAGKEGHA